MIQVLTDSIFLAIYACNLLNFINETRICDLYNIWIMNWNYNKCIFQEQNVVQLQGKPHVQEQETSPNVAQQQGRQQELEEEMGLQLQK